MRDWKEPQPYYDWDRERAEKQERDISYSEIRKKFIKSIGHGDCGDHAEMEVTKDKHGRQWFICLGCEQGWPGPELMQAMREVGMLKK